MPAITIRNSQKLFVTDVDIGISMALCLINNNKLEAINLISSREEKVLEKNHIQQLSKNNISIFADDLNIVVEELGSLIKISEVKNAAYSLNTKQV